MLDRLGRCLTLFVSTESTSCQEFASQFGIDIFLYAKYTIKYIKKYTPSWLGATDPSNSDNLNGDGGGGCVRVYVRARARACVHTYVCACVRACVRAACVRTCVHAYVRDVFAIYENNI